MIVTTLFCLLGSGLCLAPGDKVGSGMAKEASSNISMNQEAYNAGIKAYIYFYPLVTMDIIRKKHTNVEAREGSWGGPENEFHSLRALPTASDTQVVRPNFDTLFSLAWLNLTDGPVIVSVNDTKGRWYLLETLDMWTDVFADPGKRTTGTNASNFAVVPLSWNGKLPKEVTDKFVSPTTYAWILGRTYIAGESDNDAVHKVQDGYKITPLSQWGKKKMLQKPKVNIDKTIDMETPTIAQVNSMTAADYFKYAAEIMKKNPPHISDQPLLSQMKRTLDIEPGKSFDFEKLDPATKMALKKVPVDAQRLMAAVPLPMLAHMANGWGTLTENVGAWGDDYLRRAIGAQRAIGLNLPEDTVYAMLLADADGKPINGNNRYVLHFNQSKLPVPVNAFWSITLYDRNGFLIPNKLNRFAVSDHSNLTYNADGSLDIYIQNDSPGLDKESNWLPSGTGPIGITMRLYDPKMEVLRNMWLPPPLKKVE
jgi:hypothetical protein